MGTLDFSGMRGSRFRRCQNPEKPYKFEEPNHHFPSITRRFGPLPTRGKYTNSACTMFSHVIGQEKITRRSWDRTAKKLINFSWHKTLKLIGTKRIISKRICLKNYITKIEMNRSGSNGLRTTNRWGKIAM